MVEKYCADCGRGLMKKDERAVNKKLHYHVACFLRVQRAQLIPAPKPTWQFTPEKMTEKYVAELEAKMSMVNESPQLLIGGKNQHGEYGPRQGNPQWKD